MKGARFTNDRVSITVEGGSQVATVTRRELHLGDFETIDDKDLNLDATRVAALDGAIPNINGLSPIPDPQYLPDNYDLDSDATPYIKEVEVQDGQELELEVRGALNRFVIGLKYDEIWDDIDACLIMAGARTLAGALVPLKGPPTTSVAFSDLDYDRVTGLKGDGSSKYLDTGVSNAATPQNDNHNAVWVSERESLISCLMGAGFSDVGANNILSHGAFRNRSQDTFSANSPQDGSLLGVSRSLNSFVETIRDNNITTHNVISQAPYDNNVYVFATSHITNVVQGFTDSRLGFYSIGTSIDLEKLNHRVSILMAEIEAALI